MQSLGLAIQLNSVRDPYSFFLSNNLAFTVAFSSTAFQRQIYVWVLAVPGDC